MRITFLSFFLTVACSVLADVTYNVIGLPETETNTFAVEINKKLYPLSTSKESFPLWSANVAGVSSSSRYRYVQLDRKKNQIAKESFLRSSTGQHATVNEFFNRQTTLTSFSAIKQVYKDVRPKNSYVFDSSQIATILLSADPDKFADMMNNPMEEERRTIKADFKFINAENNFLANEVDLKVSGHGSRKYLKVSLRVEFNDKNGGLFFGRQAIKLRAEYIDPTMFREKLYLDLLNSVGVASYQGSYTRVYVNGKPHGFFLMVEDIDESMLLHTIHHDALKDRQSLGSLYQMGSGSAANMVFSGTSSSRYDSTIYENKILGNNPEDEPMQQFIAFMKDLQDWNPSDPNGVAFWSERLDLEGFLRSMALEYLTAAWDAFWWRGNNYYMYFNTQRNIWQLIPTDFDHSFSSGDHRYVETTYKNYGHNAQVSSSKKHPLITKLIYENKNINKKFETILSTITHDLFNGKALDERISTYETQIEQEVAWDRSIDRSDLPGIDLHWTIADFHKSIRGPVNTVPNGIKPWIKGRAKSVARQIHK